MNELSSEKTMTMQEIANAMGVSYDTVNNCVKRVFPNKLQHGKRAYFNETEVTVISKELKSNTYVASHQTVEVSSTVKNTATELEVLANYKKATADFVALLEVKNKELLAQTETQQERISELENQVEYNKVIDCRRWTDVKKEYRLTKLNKAKVKETLKEEVDWFEKCLRKDKFPTLLIKPQAIIKLVQINASI